MTEVETDGIELELLELRKLALKHARASARDAVEAHEAEQAYLKSEAELREVMLQRPTRRSE